MRRCSRCRKELPLTAFAPKGTRRDGSPRLQPYCRPCNREYQQAHYRTNAAAYKANAKVRRECHRRDLVERVIVYLREHPCVDCGNDNPVVLQFDHVRGVKIEAVSRLIRANRPWRVVLAEIEKCDVRCANCHTIRTASQFGWGKHLAGVLGAVDE